MPVGAYLISAFAFSSETLRASSAFLRSVISLNMSTTPVVFPSLLLMGAQLSSIATFVPSFLIRTV